MIKNDDHLGDPAYQEVNYERLRKPNTSDNQMGFIDKDTGKAIVEILESLRKDVAQIKEDIHAIRIRKKL